MQEKSSAPCSPARARLNDSRTAAATGIGTFAACAELTISDMSLCARSMVKPGVLSPANTLEGKFIRNWPLLAEVPSSTCIVFTKSRPKRCDSASASPFTCVSVMAT